MLQSPWPFPSTVVDLRQPCLGRCRALRARSDDHMVIMEAEAWAEQLDDKDEASRDQSTTSIVAERLADSPSHASRPDQLESADGNYIFIIIIIIIYLSNWHGNEILQCVNAASANR